jgi:serine/threonine protein kinase/tetratricopeptide (TPR) repeat protein
MSEPSRDLWIRIEELFHAAEERPIAGRDQWIDAQTESEEVRREVKSLLAGLAIHEKRCQSGPPAESSGDEEPALPLARFGPYQPGKLIGRGGMGAVYLATRVDGQFNQTVALKTIGFPLAPSEFLRRFQIERQLLASLAHPHITRLLDGGVSSAGDPYLVMEYIDGPSLDRYCDERQLSVEERLRIFLQVLSAVEYAHRNLIVHRDLKPANILVDAEGSTKLLDFGTASLIETGEMTATRMRMLTPRYASPEQLRGERVNTSTDVYSLGIVLYELLTGAWPFGNPESLVAELSRATGKMTAIALAKAVTEGSASQRSVSRQQLAQSLKGDLSAITMKALENEPGLRYGSVREFAADIENFLAGKPVLAHPQTSMYRAGKFIRRRWLVVSGIAVFVIGITAAALVATYQARLARDRYADMRSLTTSLLFELKDAINDIPGATKAQQILANRVLKNLDKLSQSSDDADLQLELAEAFRQLGELQGDPYVQNLNDEKGALASLAKAKSIADRVAARRPKDAAWLRLAGLTEQDIGEVYFGMGQPTNAIDHGKASVALFDQMITLTRNPAWLADAAGAYGSLGDIYGQPATASFRDTAQAAAQYRHVIELDEMTLKIAPGAIRSRRGKALMQMKIGDLLRHADPASALEYFDQALRGFEALPKDELAKPVNQRFRANFFRKKGGDLGDLDQWEEAEAAIQQAIGVNRTAVVLDSNDFRATYDLAVSLGDLDELLYRHQDNERALAVADQIALLDERLVGEAPENQVWRLNLAHTRCIRGTLLARLGLLAQGWPVSKAGLEELGKMAAEKNAASNTLIQACDCYRSVEPAELRDPRRAVALAQRNIAMGQETDPFALYLLAMTYQADGRKEEAKETAARALALIAPARGKFVSYRRTELEAIH